MVMLLPYFEAELIAITDAQAGCLCSSSRVVQANNMATAVNPPSIDEFIRFMAGAPTILLCRDEESDSNTDAFDAV